MYVKVYVFWKFIQYAMHWDKLGAILLCILKKYKKCVRIIKVKKSCDIFFSLIWFLYLIYERQCFGSILWLIFCHRTLDQFFNLFFWHTSILAHRGLVQFFNSFLAHLNPCAFGLIPKLIPDPLKSWRNRSSRSAHTR